MSGVKIPFALDIKGNKVSISDYYKLGAPQPIFCGGKDCGALLNHVSEFKREGKNGSQHIPAHFRLAKNIDHADHCIYKSSGNHNISVDLSDQDVIAALKRGDDLFRIHIVDNDDKRKIELRENDFVHSNKINSVKRDYRPKGKTSTYIKTVRSLKEIYLYGLNNPAARSKIQLLVNGEKRSWRDFFYSIKQYETLKQKIKNEGVVKAAVIGRVNALIFPKKHNPFEHVEFHPQRRNSGPDNYPVIKLTKSMSSKSFKFGSSILFYGGFSLEINPQKKIISSAVGDEIKTIVSSESQIIEI